MSLRSYRNKSRFADALETLASQSRERELINGVPERGEMIEAVIYEHGSGDGTWTRRVRGRFTGYFKQYGRYTLAFLEVPTESGKVVDIPVPWTRNRARVQYYRA